MPRCAIHLPGLGPVMPLDDRTHAAAIRTRDFIAQHGERAFGRDDSIGHVTGSGFILSPDRRRTLLLHHRKLDRWLQPGGHCDGETDVAATARRELCEETGSEAISLLSREIFDIDVHEIPAKGDAPAHLHHDIRYLFEMDPQVPIPGNGESLALRWLTKDELHRVTDAPSVLIVGAIMG